MVFRGRQDGDVLATGGAGTVTANSAHAAAPTRPERDDDIADAADGLAIRVEDEQAGQPTAEGPRQR
jgi:hypothetical protein